MGRSRPGRTGDGPAAGFFFTTSTDVRYLGWEFSLPLGVLILLAAIAGALIMALFAGFRILQLRMRARKARKLSARAH